MNTHIKIIKLSVIIFLMLCSCNDQRNKTAEINLNGNWEIAKTENISAFPVFSGSKAPVPGLVDLAAPAIDSSFGYNEGIYWYKTSFTTDQSYPQRAQLRLGKAKYHARIYLNDRFVGEQVYCFTSKTFDIHEFLKKPGQKNELLIGVGTASQIPDTVIWGYDYEKLVYIPGIYDDVKIILSDYPVIENIQTVPMIEDKKVRVVADLNYGEEKDPAVLRYQIRELASGKIVATGKTKSTDFEVNIPGCQLWSPENPFLYELLLSTNADEKRVRFGMRSFSFDPSTGRAMLNGKPYFMRGTNVCIFRFFEDPERGLLPWTDEWVIRLHEQFKSMHWNSIRYCIGLPPERWYEIADSLGFLIQNEYPVWTGPDRYNSIYPQVTASHLAGEFRSWLPEHWNHPSVVIWDAQNESVTGITAQAIKMVRSIDLSNRPWENGWSQPQSESDPVESHPYLFIQYLQGKHPSDKGPLADFLYTKRIPDNDVNQWDPPKDKHRYNNPVIINEYAWLWLNRDGSTTTLTDQVYDVAFGKNLSTDQRIHLYSTHLGMLTEYWRAHRLCAGVLHFCGLGYSRPQEPRGQTSDNFIDIKNLTYEPRFVKYVKPSFSPVGLMINFWDQTVPKSTTRKLEVYAINDLEQRWDGVLKIYLKKEESLISLQQAGIQIEAFDRIIHNFEIEIPSETGNYTLEAEIEYNGIPVKSIREFSVSTL